MPYQIDCIVQEIEFMNGTVKNLKIKGVEGFLLKQGNEEYNVFCPEEMPKKDKISQIAFLVNVKTVLSFAQKSNSGSAQILSQVMTSHTKVRLKFDCQPPENIIKTDQIEISSESITLL